MKIMYICGMYVPSHGGAEISVYSVLKQLKEKFRWNVLVITDSRYEKTKHNRIFNKIKIKTVQHKTRVKEIEESIVTFKPDIILTQLMWSDVALTLAKKHNIPSIMRVCKVPIGLDLSKKSEYSPKEIIAISKYVKEYVKKEYGRNAYVILPLVETKKYIISDKTFNPINNQPIFMFNPLLRKGGEIFKSIAQRLSDKKFGTVFGWSSLKKNQNSITFSKKYVKRVTESEGSSFDGSLPKYSDIDSVPNIEIFRAEDDVRHIYKKMRLLLIPSQWEEAFGRVAAEAMLNGIPVIASNVAGLKDSVGKGGVLVKKEKVSEWVEEILKFDNPIYYKKMSRHAKEWIMKSYSEREILYQTAQLIKRTAAMSISKGL